jgi:hypothetical protein
VHYLLQVCPLPHQDELGLPHICQRAAIPDRHLEGDARLPRLKPIVLPRLRVQAGLPLLELQDRVDRLQGLTRHYAKCFIQVLAETVQLIKQIKAQDRQELIPGDEQLQFRHADQQLVLHDIRLIGHHLREAGIPVRLNAGLRGSRGRQDAPVVRWRQTKQVAKLSLRVQKLRGLVDVFQSESFELFGSLGDRLPLSRADFFLGDRLLEDLLAELNRGLAGSIDRTRFMISALKRQTDASAFSRATTIGARFASKPAGTG